MAWFDELPLKYDQLETKNALKLLKRAYADPVHLKEVAKLAGIKVGSIDFRQSPSYLPMEVMDRAAMQGSMKQLLAEVLLDESVRGIHEDLWKLLGADARTIYTTALATKADYDRLALLPEGVTYSVNDVPATAEKIVNALAKFNDTAVFRFDMAKCEARVVRVHHSGKGQGTGWLVAPNLILTAYHVVSPIMPNWNAITVELDYKVVPKLDNLVLSPGRFVGLSAVPLIAHSPFADTSTELSEAGPGPGFLDFALLELAEPVGDQGLGPEGKGDENRGWFKLPAEKLEFESDEGLLVLGHPLLAGGSEAGPMKLTFGIPSSARLSSNGSRVRYRINTECGSSGSPVMDQDFRPVALHHWGHKGLATWDLASHWPKGFNQGIPLDLIAAAIREQVEQVPTLDALGLQ